MTPFDGHVGNRLSTGQLSAQMDSQWAGSRPSVISLYQHSRVPVPKSQACITHSG